MVNQELVNYLKENTKKGYTLEQLKTVLLKNGYNDSEIKEAINSIGTSQTEGSLNKTMPITEKPAKSTDLKIAIILTSLWGLFSFLNIPVLLNPASQTDFIIAGISILIGISLLVSSYGLWTIKKWGFDLYLLSSIALIIINLFGGVYLGVLIDIIVLYVIYKNKELYL